MHKNSFLLAISLLAASYLIAQQQHLEDYKIYKAIIKTEIPDTAKSVVIIKSIIRSQETKDNTSSIVDELKSKDPNNLQQVYFWTEAYDGKRPIVIDSMTRQYIIDYCANKFDSYLLSDQFDSSPEIHLINKFPIKQHSIDEDWKAFYKNYPDAGGIFAFSKVIYYSSEKNTAICYYWHRRNGLNGHGALAVMTKINSDWKIKYKTYLWWN